ncbi:MAG TPA: AAA family ATPase [Acidimicrobiales bacterium]|nr:AAA family ATPase [Acidimicrobiales bacterium]
MIDPNSTPVPHIGRRDELAILQESIHMARAGDVTVVLVGGEAGIGKSRLVAEALRSPEPDVIILRGESQALERLRPFGLWEDALGPVLPADVGREAGDIRTDVGSFLRSVENIASAVAAAAVGDLVVVVLEDLHSADMASLDALPLVVSRLAGRPVAILATLRPLPHPPELDRALGHLVLDGARQLSIGPLRGEEVGRLAASLLRSAPQDGLVRYLAAAGGNPLFVSQLVAALVDDGRIEHREGGADVTGQTPPPSLDGLVTRHLSGLDEDTRTLLRHAAVLGPRFPVSALVAATGQRVPEMLPSLRRSVTVGILSDEGDRLRFCHEVVWNTLYLGIPEEERAGLHRRAADALAAAGLPPTRVAGHLARSALPGDAGAVSLLRRAAADAAATAPAAAVELLERVLELTGSDDSLRREVLGDMVLPLLFSGRAGAAAEAGAAALAQTHAAHREAELRDRTAQALVVLGQGVEACVHWDAALSLPDVPTGHRAMMLASASWAQLMVGRPDRAATQAQQAVRAGEEAGNDAPVCSGLNTLSVLALLSGQPQQTIALAERAVDLDRGWRPDWGPVDPRTFLASGLVVVDRLDEALEQVRVGSRVAESRAILSNVAFSHTGLAVTLFLLGAWSDAEAEAEARLAAEEDRSRGLLLTLNQATIALISVHRGDLVAAERALDLLGPPAQLQAQLFAEWMGWARAAIAEHQGDQQLAVELLSGAWETFAFTRHFLACRTLGPDLVRLAVRIGDLERAEAVTQQVEEGACLVGAVPTARGAALRCRGLVTGDPDVLLAAVEAYRQGPRPVERGWACEDAGQALVRSGRKTEAAGLLDEALAVYGDVGATWDIERAGSLRATLGGPVPRTIPRPQRGWASLTPSESKVAELVADGLSNQEVADTLVISRYTVETHLKRVYAKLGVRSRAELAVEAGRRPASETAG